MRRAIARRWHPGWVAAWLRAALRGSRGCPAAAMRSFGVRRAERLAELAHDARGLVERRHGQGHARRDESLGHEVIERCEVLAQERRRAGIERSLELDDDLQRVVEHLRLGLDVARLDRRA